MGNLAAVESRDESDGVAVLDHVVETALELPVAVVDQDENSRTPVHQNRMRGKGGEGGKEGTEVEKQTLCCP